MKPYDDPECACHAITDDIDKKHSQGEWNMGAACKEWHDRSDDLKNNDIEFEPHSDASYSCSCPTCGRVVCGWCV